MIPCSWKQQFGIECPACGTQRSFLALIHGDLLESFSLFPALIPLVLLVIFTTIHLIYPRFTGKGFVRNGHKWIIGLFVLSATLMLSSWILKII